jgi:hypothetical protein
MTVMASVGSEPSGRVGTSRIRGTSSRGKSAADVAQVSAAIGVAALMMVAAAAHTPDRPTAVISKGNPPHRSAASGAS